MKRSTQPPPGSKRMNINIDAELLNRFKSLTALKGVNMTDVLVEFVEHYVELHDKRPKKKLRR